MLLLGVQYSDSTFIYLKCDHHTKLVTSYHWDDLVFLRCLRIGPWTLSSSSVKWEAWKKRTSKIPLCILRSECRQARNTSKDILVLRAT